MKKLILSTVILASVNVFAGPMKVIQMSRAKDQILFDLSGNVIKAGDIVKIGPQCEVEVIQAGVLKGLAKADVCRTKSEIKLGDNVVLVEAVNNEVKAEAQAFNNYSQQISVASQSYTPIVKTYEGDIVRGFGVGALITSVATTQDYEIISSDPNISEKKIGSLSSGSLLGYGVAMNYSYVPRMNIGFVGKLNIYSVSSDQAGSVTFARPEANIAFGAEEQFFGYAGLNTYFAMSGDNADSSSNGLGFQAGLGIVATKNFSFDFSYAMMNRTTKKDEVYFNTNDGETLGEADIKSKSSAISAVINYQF